MSVQDLGISVDTVWMLLAAMLVFFMQPGFALCEAGFTRSKNTANILFKNFVDFMIGSVLFWFVGFGFMFGMNKMIDDINYIKLKEKSIFLKNK